jgi:hypothetical protein
VTHIEGHGVLKETEVDNRVAKNYKKAGEMAKRAKHDKYTKDNLFKPKSGECYTTKFRLIGKETRKDYVTIQYLSITPKKHELDVRVSDAYINGKAVSLNNAEKLEAYSAALNDYFLNHAE